MDTNVQGTVQVSNARARRREVRLCGFVLLLRAGRVPTGEDHPIDRAISYALSKYQGEQAAFHWHRVYGLPVNSICIFNAYGPRVRTTGVYGAVFGVFFRQKLAGKPYTVVGDGTQRRDFIYVTDVAQAFRPRRGPDQRRALQRWGRQSAVDQPPGRASRRRRGARPQTPGEPDCTFANIAKIVSRLGWKPVVGFEDGVRRMLVDIDRWRDAPLWDPTALRRRPRPGSATSASRAPEAFHAGTA